MKLKDIVTLKTKSIVPLQDEHYHLYSLPSFDKNQCREEILGKDIQSNKYIVPDKCILFNKLNVRFKRVWRIDNKDNNKLCSTEFLPLIIDKTKVNYQYCYYLLISERITDYLCGQNTNTSGSHKRIDPLDFLNIDIQLPFIEEQTRIGSLLAYIDSKIALNRAINHNLEAMAKQLYDYWFVQFDFPNKEGKPYKSSGGEMVWNEKLKREIPKGWKDITFNSFINKNKAGDWGDDIPKDGTIKVGCVRGADIIKLNDVPTRYITSKHSDRLLEDGDIVIEVSGGSPVQATGRVALITKGVIERNGGALVCSNFCQSFSMEKRVLSEYFYYLWQNLYDNDNMFNFEGKTSGIKNFQTDVFLANHWFEVPEQLIETFHTIVSQYHLMIDQNIIENNNLIKQRDELLPLLMNGQVSVNYDLSHD
ncbi:MAG: restriction endonuclease subunit S [Bacteroides cellulosilyticus]|nr:restriction endonuclease subunit S [Bacteroides cellulosilyticus]